MTKNKVEEHMTLKDMRVNFLKQMTEYIQFHINDEEAYMSWIMLVPDEATTEDFEFIADDDELWTDSCKLFGKLVKHYERY